MTTYHFRMTPTCESRYRWLAFVRWCLAAFYVRLAYYAIDAAMVVSDRFEIECRKEELPE